jgi:3-oxoadipate enol-lactonase
LIGNIPPIRLFDIVDIFSAPGEQAERMRSESRAIENAALRLVANPRPPLQQKLAHCLQSDVEENWFASAIVGLRNRANRNSAKMNSTQNPSELLHFTERGSGPPLLLVHGLMVTGDMFDTVVDQFAARHRVIVPDLRGHGSSRGLPPPYTVSQLAMDLSHLLDHLGIPTTAVLGYSQGGAVAQQFALDHPQQCSHLVLACTYAFNMATFREKLEGHLAPILVRVLGMKRFANLIFSQGLTQIDRERGKQLAGIIASQDPNLMITAWKEAMAFDSRNHLSKIKCPTLIIVGSNDHAVPMHHAKMLHEGIIGSELVVVEGADHALIWTHAEKLVQITEQFLAA